MKVSIVTVCRNNAEGLKRTIESVRIQTFRDFEFLITDGASTDESINVIKKNADIVDSWVSESDSGIYNAMNKTLPRCKGDYVIFMNAGDCFFDAEVLEKVFSHTTTSDVIYGDVNFNETQYATQQIKTLQDFFCKSPFCHQGVFTKLEKVKFLGFREEYEIVADWVMFTTLFMEGSTFEYIPYIIAQCEGGSASADAGTNNKERLRYFENTYTKRIADDYSDLLHLKGGVLFRYYLRLEQSKKLKYYVLKILKLLHIKPA